MSMVNDIGICEFNGVKIEKYPAGYSAFSSFNPVLVGEEKAARSLTATKNGKKVKVGEVIYESMTAASRALGLEPAAISQAYRRKNRCIKGMKIEKLKH